MVLWRVSRSSFDILARDAASAVFNNVGNAAGNAGQQTAGFGNTLKAAGAALLGGGLITGLKSLYDAAAESAKVTALTEQVIKSTGGAANLTAQQVGDLAAAISAQTGVDDEAIQSGQNLLLTFTNIRNAAGEGNDIFTQTTQIMTDMSVALGTDAAGSAVQLGKALNDPIKGISALTRVGVSFTSAQKEQIAALVEAGDVMGAQKIILAELSREFGGAAEAAATPWDKLQVTLGNVVEEVGAYLIPVFSGFANFVMDDLIPAVREAAGWIGDNFGGALEAVGGFLGGLVDIGVSVVGFFADLPTPILLGAAALGAWLLLRGPIDAFLTWASVKYVSFATTVVASGGLVAGAATAIKGTLAGLLTALGGPVGLAIAGVTVGLGFLISGLSGTDEATEEVTAATESYAAALRDANGVITDSVRQAAAKAAQDAGLLDVAEELGISLPTVTDAITGQGAALETTRSALEDYIAAETTAIRARGGIKESLSEEGEAALAALDALNALSGQVGTTRTDQEQLAAATSQAAETTVAASEEAVAAIEEWRKKLQGINESFINPLAEYEGLLARKTEVERAAAEETAAATDSAEDSWEDYVGQVEVSLTEYAALLEEQIADQENWRANLVTIADRGGLEVAQILAEMGEKGIGITADMATATEEEFTRMATALIREAELAGTGATNALDRELRVMAAVGAAGAGATVEGISRQLNIGADEVRRIASQYGVNLAAGVNPLLSALGKGTIAAINGQRVPGFWDGGYTGDGGKYEPKGVVHGGEFVFTKEQTAKAGVSDLQVYAKMLDGYAGGGFVSASDVPRPSSTAPYRLPLSTGGDAAMQREYDVATEWLRANAAVYTGAATPNGVGGLGPAAARAVNYIRSAFGFQGTIGGYAYRNIAGTNVLSQHALGKAIDVMTYSDQALAQRIADYFAGPGRAAFGVNNVITNRRINSGGGWEPYYGVSPHTDHAHIDFYKTGTDYVPRTGPAILHQGEAVIPAEVNARRGAPLDLSDSTIERLARAMIRGAGSVVAHGNDRQARNVRSAR